MGKPINIEILLVRLRKPVISLLLCAYLFCAFVAACPPSAITRQLTVLLVDRLGSFGLFKNFGVFAPSLDHENHVWHAVITYADGTRRIWIFPSTAQSRGKPLEQEHRFSWTAWQDFMTRPDNPAAHELLLNAARYIAWLNRGSDNQPVLVSIFREDCLIVIPSADSHAQDRANMNSVCLIDYAVGPEDLR